MSLERLRALLAEVEPAAPWEATVNDMHGFHAAPEDADAIASDDAGEEPSEIRLSGGTARMAPNLHGSDETPRGPGSYRSIDRIAEEDAFSMDEWEIRERHAQYELVAELRNNAETFVALVDAAWRESAPVLDDGVPYCPRCFHFAQRGLDCACPLGEIRKLLSRLDGDPAMEIPQ